MGLTRIGPELAPLRWGHAAMGAVRESRYRPYTLSGEPVEVDTTVNVNFHFDR